MSLGNFIRSIMQKNSPPDQAKSSELDALSKIESDINGLEKVILASASPEADISEPSFIPDAKFLDKIKDGYVSQIRKNYPIDLVDSHLEHGYLKLSSIDFDVLHAKVSTLKEILKSKGIETTGKKADLVTRVLENFNEVELLAFPLDSRYCLTESGEKIVNQYLIAESGKRLKCAIELARPIVRGDLKTASEMLRPSPTSTSGAQDWPQGIWRYINDVGCDDGILIVAIVESRLLMQYHKIILPDFRHFGYEVDEDALSNGFTGSCAYYEVFLAEKNDCLYKIHPCSCPECQSMNGRLFSPSEAKIGSTLPPFSKHCVCAVAPEYSRKK